jgi:hypothetical protein
MARQRSRRRDRSIEWQRRTTLRPLGLRTFLRRVPQRVASSWSPQYRVTGFRESPSVRKRVNSTHRAAAGRPSTRRRSAEPASRIRRCHIPPTSSRRPPVPNLQDGPEESRIARITVLALARVAEGGRVIGVERNTTVGLLVDVLGPASTPPRPDASRLPAGRCDRLLLGQPQDPDLR